MNRNLPKIMSALLAVCMLFCLCANVASATSGDAGSVFSRSSDTKKIALTFDDGPHPRYTEKILDLLGEYDIKATFFVIGSNLDMYGDVVSRAVSEGHEIGNHTTNHPHMNKLKYSDFVNEIFGTEKMVFEKTGVKTKLFRPPEGKCTPELKRFCKENGYSIILWSIDTMDWNENPSDKIACEVMQHLHGGDIILFHDYVSRKNTTIPALKMLIPKLIEQGYEFVTVSELIESDLCQSDGE